ncbi:hypothetical protein DFJ77DRAFT_130118 [Powellomyces hirtus]|nr:hypothetical protein DFJ77DRAFT_130118 [Powellomyces hirtus]
MNDQEEQWETDNEVTDEVYRRAESTESMMSNDDGSPSSADSQLHDNAAGRQPDKKGSEEEEATEPETVPLAPPSLTASPGVADVVDPHEKPSSVSSPMDSPAALIDEVRDMAQAPSQVVVVARDPGATTVTFDDVKVLPPADLSLSPYEPLPLHSLASESHPLPARQQDPPVSVRQAVTAAMPAAHKEENKAIATLTAMPGLTTTPSQLPVTNVAVTTSGALQPSSTMMEAKPLASQPTEPTQNISPPQQQQQQQPTEQESVSQPPKPPPEQVPPRAEAAQDLLTTAKPTPAPPPLSQHPHRTSSSSLIPVLVSRSRSNSNASSTDSTSPISPNSYKPYRTGPIKEPSSPKTSTAPSTTGASLTQLPTGRRKGPDLDLRVNIGPASMSPSARPPSTPIRQQQQPHEITPTPPKLARRPSLSLNALPRAPAQGFYNNTNSTNNADQPPPSPATPNPRSRLSRRFSTTRTETFAVDVPQIIRADSSSSTGSGAPSSPGANTNSHSCSHSHHHHLSSLPLSSGASSSTGKLNPTCGLVRTSTLSAPSKKYYSTTVLPSDTSGRPPPSPLQWKRQQQAPRHSGAGATASPEKFAPEVPPGLVRKGSVRERAAAINSGAGGKPPAGVT